MILLLGEVGAALMHQAQPWGTEPRAQNQREERDYGRDKPGTSKHEKSIGGRRGARQEEGRLA